MGRYSSDSDSSSYKSRSRRKRRSSSSSSNSGKHSSYRSKHSSSSSRRDHSTKKSSRHKSRRSRSKSSRSRSRSSHHSRSYSRENSRRRSRSYDKLKSKSHKGKTSSRCSSSKSESSRNSSPFRKNLKPPNSAQALREKLLKSIQAGDLADKVLKKQGALSKNYKSRNDLASLIPSKPSLEVLNEIENDSFQQRTFVSVKNIEMPEIKLENGEEVPAAKSVLPSGIFDDQESKLNRWVKKLFQIRQRVLKGDGVE